MSSTGVPGIMQESFLPEHLRVLSARLCMELSYESCQPCCKEEMYLDVPRSRHVLDMAFFYVTIPFFIDDERPGHQLEAR